MSKGQWKDYDNFNLIDLIEELKSRIKEPSRVDNILHGMIILNKDYYGLCKTIKDYLIEDDKEGRQIMEKENNFPKDPILLIVEHGSVDEWINELVELLSIVNAEYEERTDCIIVNGYKIIIKEWNQNSRGLKLGRVYYQKGTLATMDKYDYDTLPPMIINSFKKNPVKEIEDITDVDILELINDEYCYNYCINKAKLKNDLRMNLKERR